VRERGRKKERKKKEKEKDRARKRKDERMKEGRTSKHKEQGNHFSSVLTAS
jgi:hypothetical protein